MKRFTLERYPSNKDPRLILEPRKDVAWEAGAVFNPCVVHDNGIFRMLYRTYSDELSKSDPYFYKPGLHLLHQISYIGYAESKDGIHFERRDAPFISPDQPFDAYGCEDPRITKIGETFYITYTAIDAPIESKKFNVRIALAVTDDFVTVTKHGIIGPQKTSKASALFGEPVNGGKTGLALTISSDSVNSHVAVRYFDSIESLMKTDDKSWEGFLEHSQDTALLKTYPWLHRGPELGAPPIKTTNGWLWIFSAESMSNSWTISVALSDLRRPHKLIARAKGYILQPVTAYEKEGLTPNVTFPEGAVLVGNDLYVYYGCADSVIGLATCKLNELLDYLEGFKA
jgi:predicted GH43/DUF377 family glycosyl hydrolase